MSWAPRRRCCSTRPTASTTKPSPTTEPDVILAAYSGLTQEEYDTLSKIAPVIAYPTVAWGTSVNDMIEMDSKALGLEKEGKALIEQLDADAQKALEANSVLKDKKVLFSYIDPTDLSQVGYYTAVDTRPVTSTGWACRFPSIVEENKDSDQFYLTVSAEEAQKFDDVDLFITYGDETIIPLLQADPLLSKIPAIAEGRIAVLPDATPSRHRRTRRRCPSRGASATTSRSWLHRSRRSRSIRRSGVNAQ